MKRRSLINAIALSCVAVMNNPTIAQENWPSKPVKVIVPFPAGGTTDIVTRLVADELGRSLKQPFIIENKAGANGNIGSAEAARSMPDGYTLLATGIGSHAINPGLYPKMPFDAMNDFVHISQYMAGPNVLVVSPSFPAKSLKEFVALAKSQPGKLNYASSGNGSSGHLAMELLKVKAGIFLTHIPYRGGSPALTDVIGGSVPAMFINQDVALQHVKAGKLRAIGVASLERNPLFPDVPTLAEQGFPGFAAVSWIGLSAPKGTPAPISQRLSSEIQKALQSTEIKSRLEAQGFKVVGSTPSQYTDFIRSETERWGQVIKTQGIRLD
jgi:tripartite-type tricarboxylate transporter receptor subunit TctC